jgi:hypothetical protein
MPHSPPIPPQGMTPFVLSFSLSFLPRRPLQPCPPVLLFVTLSLLLMLKSPMWPSCQAAPRLTPATSTFRFIQKVPFCQLPRSVCAQAVPVSKYVTRAPIYDKPQRVPEGCIPSSVTVDNVSSKEYTKLLIEVRCHLLPEAGSIHPSPILSSSVHRVPRPSQDHFLGFER